MSYREHVLSSQSFVHRNSQVSNVILLDVLLVAYKPCQINRRLLTHYEVFEPVDGAAVVGWEDGSDFYRQELPAFVLRSELSCHHGSRYFYTLPGWSLFYHSCD